MPAERKKEVMKSKAAKDARVRYHVWNGKPGNPTIVFYLGSGNAWDGLSASLATPYDRAHTGHK